MFFFCLVQFKVISFSPTARLVHCKLSYGYFPQYRLSIQALRRVVVYLVGWKNEAIPSTKPSLI